MLRFARAHTGSSMEGSGSGRAGGGVSRYDKDWHCPDILKGECMNKSFSSEFPINRRSFLQRGALAVGLFSGGAATRAFAAGVDAGSPGATVETTAGKVRGTVHRDIH